MVALVRIYLDRSVCVGNSWIHPSSQNRKEGRWPAHQITENLCVFHVFGRWPAHQITENLCAPFIHGFIVDEWETTNHKPREGPTGQVSRSLRKRNRAPFIAFFAMSGRGNRLPEGVRLREGEPLCFPTQAAKDAAWMGHNPSREDQK